MKMGDDIWKLGNFGLEMLKSHSEKDEIMSWKNDVMVLGMGRMV